MLYGRHTVIGHSGAGLRGQEGRRIPHQQMGPGGQEKLRVSLWPWPSKAWLEADFAPPAALVVSAEVYLLLLQAQPLSNES